MISTSSLEMVSLSRRRWFNATLQEEIESLKTQLSGFMSSIEGCLRDIDADLLTLENNHQVPLNSVLDEVTILRKFVVALLPRPEGCPNKIKIPELRFKSMRLSANVIALAKSLGWAFTNSPWP